VLDWAGVAMTQDDPEGPLRFRVGVGLFAVSLVPVLSWFVRLVDGDFQFSPLGWSMSIAGVALALTGVVLAARGMPAAANSGWRRLGIGAAVALPGVVLLLTVQNVTGM
jgi:VIT1/CCC1 family predicted Fe2+/Mn2+ transporter